MSATEESFAPSELLARYFDAADAEAADALGLVIDGKVLATIKATVQRRMYASAESEREDICSEAVTTLIRRLNALRLQPGERTEIADIGAYAAGVAVHAVHAHVASKCPGRSRLRRRLRAVLTMQERFRLWETAGGSWLCGAAGSTETATPAEIEECRRELATRRLPGEIDGVLDVVFGCLPKAVELNALTNLLAASMGLDGAESSTEGLEQTAVDPAAPTPWRLELLDWMKGVWREIQELPERQRMALLLSMRTPDGAAIALIADLGLAGFADLARAVGLGVEELAAIWDRLPLGDLEIGERLGIPRQQVINLRSSARQRLERRFKPD